MQVMQVLLLIEDNNWILYFPRWELSDMEKQKFGGILDNLKINLEGSKKLYYDDKSAINIAHNPIQHDRTKHIEIDRHFIQEKLEKGLVSMSYISSVKKWSFNQSQNRLKVRFILNYIL